MIFKKREGNVWKAGFVLFSILVLSVSAAYGADSPVKQDPGEWKKVVEAAKKEGKLVMAGDPSEIWRKAVVDTFQQEYPEIKVEYTGILGRDFLPRLRQERAIGQKLWDLLSGGATTGFEAKRSGFLAPVRPLLLPEIADEGKWMGGMEGLFTDKESKFIPCYTIYVEPTTSVNRDFIKESELKSSGQLLDPKFKGKIVMQTPHVGATFQALGNLSHMYGEKFIRDLLSRQSVIITEDKRQQAEWLVRGKYPIAVGFIGYQLIPFLKQGLGKNVTTLEDKIIPASVGGGAILLFKDAPHPNAARVYINWLLSQKTQMLVSKSVRLNSLRTDVPPVVKELAVDPERLSDYRFQSTEENTEITSRILPVIKEALQK